MQRIKLFLSCLVVLLNFTFFKELSLRIYCFNQATGGISRPCIAPLKLLGDRLLDAVCAGIKGTIELERSVDPKSSLAFSFPLISGNLLVLSSAALEIYPQQHVNKTGEVMVVRPIISHIILLFLGPSGGQYFSSK